MALSVSQTTRIVGGGGQGVGVSLGGLINRICILLYLHHSFWYIDLTGYFQSIHNLSSHLQSGVNKKLFFLKILFCSDIKYDVLKTIPTWIILRIVMIHKQHKYEEYQVAMTITHVTYKHIMSPFQSHLRIYKVRNESPEGK